MTDERLQRLYEHVSVHATAELEHEAVIELLLLVMMADQRISTDEIEAIRSFADDAGFESATFSFDQYLGPAVAKVRTARSTPDGVDELLDSIDRRIASRVLRQSLFAAAREIADVDDDIDPAEEDLLGQIAARFA